MAKERGCYGIATDGTDKTDWRSKRHEGKREPNGEAFGTRAKQTAWEGKRHEGKREPSGNALGTRAI